MKTFKALCNASYWILLMLALSTCSEPEQPKPSLNSLFPDEGPIGTQVTVEGEHFSGVTTIQFGNATSAIASKGDQKITTVVPPGLTPGEYGVTVKSDGGTSNSLNFKVIPGIPEITAIVPDKASAGMQVDIKGNYLGTATLVHFGDADITTFVSKSDNSVTVEVPDLAIGAHDVSITTTGGTSAVAGFTIVGKPTITSFTPATGAIGKAVNVTGTYLEDASSVFFGDKEATFQVSNATLISTEVPAGAVTSKIRVITAGGEALSNDDFVVKEIPVVTDFTPTSGIVGSVITLNGINFTADVWVKFGNVAATVVTFVSSTQITAKVPVGAVTGAVSVGNDAGSTTTGAAFTVIGPPVITSLSPDRGGVGTDVSIAGGGFVDVSSVKFNSKAVPVGDVTVVSETMIMAKVPSGASTGKVSVVTAAGTAQSPSAFTVLPPPTITSFTPAIGPVGLKVTITGTHFEETQQVYFGAKQAAFDIKSATSIEATVPNGATTGKIRVVTLGGEAISTDNYIVKDAPEITSFTPASGVVGTLVTINGKNFDAGGVVVRFGTGAANTINVVSATQITAIVPAAAVTGKITVETAAGSVLSGTNFTVIGAPTVSLFAPTSGTFGVDVVITGSNFVNVSAVKFNNTSVSNANYTVNSPTQITAKVPGGATTGKIAITTPAGTGTSSNNFTIFPPPTITGFDPAIGPVNTSLTVTGTNFTGATQVYVGSTEAAFTVNSATQITLTVPSGASTGKIKVVTPGGEATSTTDFVVKDPPVISSFSPASGIVGTTVTINGSNFDAGGVVVKFGTGTATEVTVVNATQITAKVPAAATTGKITVQTVVGSVLSANNFTVIGVPTITNISPLNGPIGTPVTITGTNFINVSDVKFNNTSVSPGNYTVVSATQITAQVPGGATSGKVSVTTPAGTATSSSDFTILPPPVITSFTPGSGPAGSSIVITGTGFVGITSVSINDVNAPSFTVNSSTQVTVSVPANATSGKIKVTNAVSTATSANSYYVTPFISTITPSVGSPGTVVTISGTNLDNATVNFNGTAVVPTTNTGTTITVAVPSIATGAKTITVVNLGGTSNGKTFTVTDPVVLNEIVATQNIGGQLLLLSGSNLSGATKVLFNNTETAVITNTPTLVSTTIPASLPVGSYTVKLVTSNGTSNGKTFERLSAQNPNSSDITLTNGLSVVSLPPGYVPPISNLWESTLNPDDQFSIQEIDVDVIEVAYQNGSTQIFGTNIIFDKTNNYIEFTIDGVRFVGMWLPAGYIGEVDCYHYMTLISAESGQQLKLRVSTFNDGCPF